MATQRINDLSFQLGQVHETLSEVSVWSKDPRKPLNVSSQVGGVAQALGAGQLPRNEKQVTNMRRSE